MSHVTPRRACHMLPPDARVTCYPGARVSQQTPMATRATKMACAQCITRPCTAKQSKGQAKQVWRVWEGVFWRGGVFFLGAGGGSNNAADLSRECRQRTRQNFRTRTGYATLCCVGLASFILWPRLITMPCPLLQPASRPQTMVASKCSAHGNVQTAGDGRFDRNILPTAR